MDTDMDMDANMDMETKWAWMNISERKSFIFDIGLLHYWIIQYWNRIKYQYCNCSDIGIRDLYICSLTKLSIFLKQHRVPDKQSVYLICQEKYLENP
jgi:hypothetical protein